MDIPYLLRGLIIGFSIAAPVGPIGVLCIRRTLAHGRWVGLASGLGAATADGAYGLVAGFGLTFISNILIDQQTLLKLFGGIFLLYLGIRIFLETPANQAVEAPAQGLAAAYASTFFLTLTNPATILSFAAIFAGLGLGASNGDYASASRLVLGIFLGSAAWWLLLSVGVSLLRTRFTMKGLVWVNRVSGSIITLFGLAALISILA